MAVLAPPGPGVAERGDRLAALGRLVPAKGFFRSEALAAWMAERDVVAKVSSEVAAIELVRACRRVDDDAVGPARQLLAGMDLVPMGLRRAIA